MTRDDFVINLDVAERRVETDGVAHFALTQLVEAVHAGEIEYGEDCEQCGGQGDVRVFRG